MTTWTGLPLETRQLGTMGKYTVQLLLEVTYEANGERVVAREGYVTDLTSVPFWVPVQKEGPWTPASVIHDRLYSAGEYFTRVGGQWVRTPITKRRSDRIFYEAILSLGVHPKMARLLYLGPVVWGWRRWRKARRVQAENQRKEEA